MGGLRIEQGDNTEAILAYEKAFNLLQSNRTQLNPENTQILNVKTVESIHRQLIKLLPSGRVIYDLPFLNKVRESLKNYYLSELEKLMKAGNWKEADLKTTRFMLYVAQREQEGLFDVESTQNLSCPDLKEIDSLWLQHSNKNFGFSVQKQIWLDTGNKLSITKWTKSDEKAFRRFAFDVGWSFLTKDAKLKWVSKREEFTYLINPAKKGQLPSFIYSDTDNILRQNNILPSLNEFKSERRLWKADEDPDSSIKPRETKQIYYLVRRFHYCQTSFFVKERSP